MKKWLIRLISVAFALVLTFSAIGCSCNDDEVPSADENGYSANIYYNGTHVYTATDMDVAFVSNGKSEYKIVVPENPTKYEMTARQEFSYLFKLATGFDLQVVTDATVQYDASAKYISIGETKLLGQAGVSIDKNKISESGVRIVTEGNTVFIAGGGKEGVIYGVYDFMEIMFNYDCFYEDCVYIDSVRNANLKDFDVTDIPDFKIRTVGYGLMKVASGIDDPTSYRNRMRFNNSGAEMVIGLGGQSGHNTLRILPISTYGEEHPNWYATTGLQLCYTARGDEAELEAMVSTIVDKCIEALESNTEDSYPDKIIFPIVMEDNGGYCTCAACTKKAGEHGGAVSGQMNVVMNMIAREFVERYEILQAENPGDIKYTRDSSDFRFMQYAYLYSMSAPVTKNEDGTYSPASNEVICDDNVIIRVCLSDFYTWYSIFDSVNAGARAAIEGWSVVAQNMFYWTYSANFHNEFYPYYDWNHMNSETYSYLVSKSDAAIYNQNVWNGSGAMTGWTNLKAYVDSKLQWNTSLDVNALIDKWFEYHFVYPEVSAQMKEVYWETVTWMRAACIDIGAEKNFMGMHLYNYSEYFPYQLVNSWLAKMDNALALLEQYKEEDNYDMVSRHIEIEALSPMYILLQLYNRSMSIAYKDELVARLYADTERLNLYNMIVKDSGALFYSWLQTIG